VMSSHRRKVQSCPISQYSREKYGGDLASAFEGGQRSRQC